MIAGRFRCLPNPAIAADTRALLERSNALLNGMLEESNFLPADVLPCGGKAAALGRRAQSSRVSSKGKVEIGSQPVSVTRTCSSSLTPSRSPSGPM